jgi:hypothetical protein
MPQKAHAFVNTRKRKRKHAASDKHAEPTTNKRNETRGRWQAVEENSRLPTESMLGRLSSRPVWPATRPHTRTLPQGRRLGWVAPGMLGVRRHRTGLGSGDTSKKECRPRIFSRDGLRPHETRPPKGDVASAQASNSSGTAAMVENKCQEFWYLKSNYSRRLATSSQLIHPTS